MKPFTRLKKEMAKAANYRSFMVAVEVVHDGSRSDEEISHFLDSQLSEKTMRMFHEAANSNKKFKAARLDVPVCSKSDILDKIVDGDLVLRGTRVSAVPDVPSVAYHAYWYAKFPVLVVRDVDAFVSELTDVVSSDLHDFAQTEAWFSVTTKSYGNF